MRFVKLGLNFTHSSMRVVNLEGSKEVFLAGLRAIVEKMEIKAPILKFGKMVERIRDYFKRFLKKN